MQLKEVLFWLSIVSQSHIPSISASVVVSTCFPHTFATGQWEQWSLFPASFTEVAELRLLYSGAHAHSQHSGPSLIVRLDIENGNFLSLKPGYGIITYKYQENQSQM